MEMTRAILVAVALSCFGKGGASGLFLRTETAYTTIATSPLTPAFGAVCYGYVMGVADARLTKGADCVPKRRAEAGSGRC